ncbi:MAG: hypothetical protein E6H09_15620 [Bacteroidetes bacterium]|jgi:hypothetical protein|nr:MAG: hypothetical protein E6H09_15620 [Bacteroidota bacterium]
MALYYLPVLIRSDRYFVAKLQSDAIPGNRDCTEFNFVTYAEDRVLAPLISIEDPDRIVLNQMAPSDRQDVLLKECHVSLVKREDGFELLIRKNSVFKVEPFYDAATGLRLDYSTSQKRIILGYYRHKVELASLNIYITLSLAETETYSGKFQFAVMNSMQCNRVVVDFGSEASQVAYKNCGPQASLVQYDILENIIGRLSVSDRTRYYKREEFLNDESGQPTLYRSFYAVKKNMSVYERKNFPFNFTGDLMNDEVRLFVTRQEVGATQVYFRDNYEIIPNLKLGIEKSLQLSIDRQSEDYSIRSHKKELIGAVLLRVLRLMISTKPEFRDGGMIVTLLVPNIYTQHDVFELLNTLRIRTDDLLRSLNIKSEELFIEYETISESDAAFMGYQQTQGSDVQLNNGEMALVIDCGKGTTDISILLADDNENYSSFFRTGFAGAGNVLSYGFAEDLLTLILRTIPCSNEISVKDFIRKQILEQHLTVDVLNFIQFLENRKKRFKNLETIGINEFAQLAEQSQSTERTIGNLYRDQSTLLQYAEAILKDRNIKWDDEITGLIHKATDCIVHCIVASVKDVITKDIKKRIRSVMLSGRAFYFEELKVKLRDALKNMLGSNITIHTVTPGRALNNKNVALYGAFTGAYKITDFTGIPIDKKEGLSKNNDILNNNMYLYRGIKIQPGNDILYNTSVVRRNNQQLKSFKNKTIDIYFTRDNIYLRLMENQHVKDVRSLYSILTSVSEIYSPVQDMKAISMFPNYSGELASVTTLHDDIVKEELVKEQPIKKAGGILQFFQF